MRARLLIFVLFFSGLALAQDDPPTSAPSTTPSGAPVATSGADAAEAETKTAPATTPLPDLTPDAAGKLSQEQINRDGKGKAKSTEVKTYESLEIYGEQVRRLIQKDDKPLDAKEAAKEEQKIQKIIDKRKNESEEDRKKREEKEIKEREDDRKFVREVSDAYDFKLVGTEEVGGRAAWVIDGEPRTGFEPRTREAKFLSKLHGRVW